MLPVAMPNLPSENASPETLTSRTIVDLPYRSKQVRTLAEAFGCFSDAASSLEHSYEALRGEVARLRRDLERSNAGRERAEDDARRSRALAEMSSVLAHEIRNPLGSMELFAGLLLDAGLNRDCREWVLHLQAGLRTLGATVNNVLDFHAPPGWAYDATDMGQLLDDVRQFVAPQAATRGVEVVVRNELRGVVAAADRNRMFQVLLNLLLNALRFLPDGGWMELSGRLATEGENRRSYLDLSAVSTTASNDIPNDASKEGSNQEIVMRVSDSGPGIAAEDLGRIFDAGFTTHPGSPGLGLAVCRRIVVQHGGSILARSRTGGGAMFEVWIPARRANASVSWGSTLRPASCHDLGETA